MDFGVVLVIGISVPVTALIVMVGINKKGGRARLSVGNEKAAATFEVGEEPERRELDRPDGISRLAAELAPYLTKAIDSHPCQNAALLSTVADVQANMIDRSIEVADHAIAKYQVNGPVAAARDALKADRVSLRRAIANPGGV